MLQRAVEEAALKEVPKAENASQGTGQQNQPEEEEQCNAEEEEEEEEEEKEVQLTHRRERPKGKKEAPKDKKKKKKKGNVKPEGFALNLDREQLVKSSFAVVMLFIWVYCGYSWVTSMLDSDEGDETIESIY